MRHSPLFVSREINFTATGTTRYDPGCREPSEIQNWKSYFASDPWHRLREQLEALGVQPSFVDPDAGEIAAGTGDVRHEPEVLRVREHREAAQRHPLPAVT